MPLLYPENETVWRMFKYLSSQVRVGAFGGFFGFDLTAVQTIFLAFRIPVEEWEDYLEKLEVIKNVAQECWNVKEEAQQQ